MFAIHNKVTKGSSNVFFFIFALYIVAYFWLFLLLFHLPTIYLGLVITLLLLFLQLWLVILLLQVLLRNQVGESS